MVLYSPRYTYNKVGSGYEPKTNANFFNNIDNTNMSSKCNYFCRVDLCCLVKKSYYCNKSYSP